MAQYPKELKKTTNLAKSNVRAGKSKATTAQRKAQNRGVKDGTVRLGKSGKTYNVYDAKSGTWKRGIVKAAGKSGGSSKPMTGRGGYGSTNKSSGTKVRAFAGGASKWSTAKPIIDLPRVISRGDSDRRRAAALSRARVVAKYGTGKATRNPTTGARAQSAVYRAERRKKK